LKQVQVEIEEVSSQILSPSQEQALAEVVSRRGDAEKLRQELTGLIAIEISLAAIEGLGGKCPTCRRPISGDVKGEEIEGAA
jgi:hypothetical protein